MSASVPFSQLKGIETSKTHVNQGVKIRSTPLCEKEHLPVKVGCLPSSVKVGFVSSRRCLMKDGLSLFEFVQGKTGTIDEVVGIEIECLEELSRSGGGEGVEERLREEGDGSSPGGSAIAVRNHKERRQFYELIVAMRSTSRFGLDTNDSRASLS